MLIKVSRGTNALARFKIARPYQLTLFLTINYQFGSATLVPSISIPRYLWVLTLFIESPSIFMFLVSTKDSSSEGSYSEDSSSEDSFFEDSSSEEEGGLFEEIGNCDRKVVDSELSGGKNDFDKNQV